MPMSEPKQLEILQMIIWVWSGRRLRLLASFLVQHQYYNIQLLEGFLPWTNYPPNVCFMSIDELLGNSLSKNFSSVSPQTTKVENIPRILPDVKVGDSLALKFFHLVPPIAKRWAAVEIKWIRLKTIYLSIT